MNGLVRDYFQPEDKKESVFYSTVFLVDSGLSWKKAREQFPQLPRGWYELCHLPVGDRIEFVRDFWLNLLPYRPRFHASLIDFFAKLDDVGVVCSQQKEKGPWSVEMIYSLRDNLCFFRGNPPATDSDLDEIKTLFSLPQDYRSFLRIHNGMGQLSDPGIYRSQEVLSAKNRIVDKFMWSDRSLRSGGRTIDPSGLIPFYESPGLESFQCFFNEWYPENGMGNVHLSAIDGTISDFLNRSEWLDQLAFPTFLDWLAYYLEGNSVYQT